MGYNIEVLKQQYPNLIEYIEQCESIINEFLDKLENKDCINKDYITKNVKTNLKNFAIVSNSSIALPNKPHNDYVSFLISLCTGYHVNSELMKKHLLIVINWDNFKLKDKSKASLGTLINQLEGKGFGETQFIKTLSKTNFIRNSVAHCTYFYKDKQIHFYKNIYDDKPREMTLEVFQEDSIKLNILTYELLLIYFERYPIL